MIQPRNRVGGEWRDCQSMDGDWSNDLDVRNCQSFVQSTALQCLVFGFLAEVAVTTKSYQNFLGRFLGNLCSLLVQYLAESLVNVREQSGFSVYTTVWTCVIFTSFLSSHCRQLKSWQENPHLNLKAFRNTSPFFE